MTKQIFVWLLLLGAVGYSSVIYLFPRMDASAKWNYELDSEQALAKAQAVALQQGLDVSGWSVGILPSRDRNLEQYLLDHQATKLESNLLSSIKTDVKFRDPKEDRMVGVTFAANGQLLRFYRTGFKLSEAEKNTPPNKAQAEKALADLLGEARTQFTFTSESEPEKGRRQWVWRYASPNERELKFDAEVTIAGTTVTRAEIKDTLPPAYREELSRRDLASFAVLGGLEFIFNVLCVMAAMVLYFLGLNRKELDHLGSLIFFTLASGLFLFSLGLTTGLSEYKGGAFRIDGVTNPTVLIILPYVIFALACFALALLQTVFWTVGESTQAKYLTGRVNVFAAALRGRIFTRPVAESITTGLLLGGLIAAVPFLLAWLMGFSGNVSDYTSRHDTFAAASPALTAIISSSLSGEFYYLMLLFAFLWPVLRVYISSSWLGAGLFGLIGTISLLDLNPNQTGSFLAKLFVAFLLLGIFIWLYWKFDLLALLAANYAAGLLLKALGLYVQPSPLLHSAGVKGLIALGVMMVVSLVLARFAPAHELESRRLLNAHIDQAERERLKAEFNVARKAQENLLPADAPQIPGFGIAAICRPARECGGDLYDFIPLRDGKLGIVVADVSGKGVPAALYMTLTKGLLLSVAETSSDPGEILREVNKHLYEVCKRKTFVTLFFAVLDPATKTLTYARAGHNPPVWRRQSEQKTQWLKPAGIGLGLNAGKSFDRVLKVEQIQLSRDDLLIFYSDGISEAMNEHQEEYGEDRLEQIAAMTDGMGAEESLSAIFANVSNFLGRELPQDDQTLVALRVT